MPEASLPKVPGAPTAPKVSSPMKVGDQATVKNPKPKKMADATDKPSVFFKTEDANKKVSIGNLRSFLENKKQKRQSSQSNERLSMDHDNKISAKEAAQAVLKKAQELLSASKLAKALPANAAAPGKDESLPEGVQATPDPIAEAPKKDPCNKGHLKLAKWCGRMEAKRSAKKVVESPAPAPHQESDEKQGG